MESTPLVLIPSVPAGAADALVHGAQPAQPGRLARGDAVDTVVALGACGATECLAHATTRPPGGLFDAWLADTYG